MLNIILGISLIGIGVYHSFTGALPKYKDDFDPSDRIKYFTGGMFLTIAGILLLFGYVDL